MSVMECISSMVSSWSLHNKRKIDSTEIIETGKRLKRLSEEYIRFDVDMEDANEDEVKSINDSFYIIVFPRQQWRVRYLKELGYKTVNAGITNEENIYFCSMILSIPDRMHTDLYISIAAYDVNCEKHVLKLVLPYNTKINMESFDKSNNLKCLNFEKCDPFTEYDIDSRIIYTRIEENDYRMKSKSMYLYMVNLYQTHILNRQLINEKQLDKCYIAVWISKRENNKYIKISETRLSKLISQIKKS